jgi:hypothetical protein
MSQGMAFQIRGAMVKTAVTIALFGIAATGTTVAANATPGFAAQRDTPVLLDDPDPGTPSSPDDPRCATMPWAVQCQGGPFAGFPPAPPTGPSGPADPKCVSQPDNPVCAGGPFAPSAPAPPLAGGPGDVGGIPGDPGGMPGDVGGRPGDFGGIPHDIGGEPHDIGGMPHDIGGAYGRM